MSLSERFRGRLRRPIEKLATPHLQTDQSPELPLGEHAVRLAIQETLYGRGVEEAATPNRLRAQQIHHEVAHVS